MKYLLPILLISSIVSCNKDNDDTPPKQFDDPKATSCNCTTFTVSQVYTVAKYTFTPIVPDTISTLKVILRQDVTDFPLFDIEKPRDSTYTYPLLFEKCPKKGDNAFYYFEFLMKGGRVVKGQRFQIGE